LSFAYALFAVRLQTDMEDWMAEFLFRLETAEGVAANPPTFESIVANWKVGDSIYLGRRTLRVVGDQARRVRPAPGVDRRGGVTL